MGENSLVVTTDGELAEVPVSMQVYQAIYNDITGKTEKITDTYDTYYSIALNEIVNLEKRLQQFCEQYHIKGANTSITIFHTKGSRERFSSFERLNTYNAANTVPVERINIELNFLIVLPKINKPQNYKVKIMLMSGVAIIDKHDEGLPKELPINVVMRAIQKDTAAIEIEYVDYIVARGISDLFKEWIKSLPETPADKAIAWWQSKSHTVRMFISTIFLLVAVYFSTSNVESFLPPTESDTAGLARYLIYSFASVFLVYGIGNYIGRRIERAIDVISPNGFSVIQINAGDQKLINKYNNKKSKSKWRVIKELLVALLVSICSFLLASYFI